MDVRSCRALIEQKVTLAAAGTPVVAGGSGRPSWDCDSIVLAEALVAVEEELSIELPMDDATARALRSIDALAAYVSEFLGAGHGQ